MHKSVETIQGRKLFKGGSFSRAETIRGNTVHEFELIELFLYDPSVFLPSTMCYMCASKNVPVVK